MTLAERFGWLAVVDGRIIEGFLVSGESATTRVGPNEPAIYFAESRGPRAHGSERHTPDVRSAPGEYDFEPGGGNKRLRRVVVLVILLAVFFTLGYLVGRNSAGDAAEAGQKPGEPLVVESPAAQSPRPVATAPTAEPEPLPERPATPPAKPTPPPREPAPTSVETPAAAASSSGAPAAGTAYLQVGAFSPRGGKALADRLSAEGFRLKLDPVPGRDLIRVMVGPLADDEIAQTRSRLQAQGFGPLLRRY